MPKVTFVNEKKEIDVPQGATLRTEARKAEVEVHGTVEKYINCFGNGLCGTCRVLVKKGQENLSPRTFRERLHFFVHPLGLFAYICHEDEIRLSCQVKVNGDCTIETHPPLNLEGENFWQKPYPNK